MSPSPPLNRSVSQPSTLRLCVWPFPYEGLARSATGTALQNLLDLSRRADSAATDRSIDQGSQSISRVTVRQCRLPLPPPPPPPVARARRLCILSRPRDDPAQTPTRRLDCSGASLATIDESSRPPASWHPSRHCPLTGPGPRRPTSWPSLPRQFPQADSPGSDPAPPAVNHTRSLAHARLVCRTRGSKSHSLRPPVLQRPLPPRMPSSTIRQVFQ